MLFLIQKNYNDDDEDEDDDEEVTPGGKKMNFARNPEEMRAEADRRRQEKMNRLVFSNYLLLFAFNKLFGYRFGRSVIKSVIT